MTSEKEGSSFVCTNEIFEFFLKELSAKFWFSHNEGVVEVWGKFSFDRSFRASRYAAWGIDESWNLIWYSDLHSLIGISGASATTKFISLAFSQAPDLLA